jgi:exopolysaccharide biosynthesis polyprenyl glycosylphosphotransferase
MAHRFKKIFLFIGDLAILNLTLLLTLSIRYPADVRNEQWQNHWPSFLAVFIIWLLALNINDLYNLNLKTNSRHFIRSAINTVLTSGLISVLYFYLNPRTAIAPKTNLLIFTALFFGLFLLWRYLFQALSRTFIPRDNLAIIGLNQRTEKLLEELKKRPAAGYETALIFKNAAELENLAASVREKNIRTIVIVDDFGQSDALREALFACLGEKITFFNYPDFYESLTGKIPIEAIDAEWFLNNLQEGHKNYFNFLKRSADIFFAGLGLLLSLPAWLIFALLIKINSRGPIFFRQTRLGQNGKKFRIIKFRTMRIENNDAAPTRKNDDRITKVGAFLRRSHLDETPQVINILRNEMSFIGPRPERPEIVAELERRIPFYKTRLFIKPGITGLDQVSGHYHSAGIDDTLEKLQYDLFYLKNRSLYLDLSIALKTLTAVFKRQGR